MKESHKKTNRDPILKNIMQLEETLRNLYRKNAKKHQIILTNNQMFKMKLFHPSIPQYQSRQQIGLAEKIMLNQIDQLMEDEEKLNIELDKLSIKEQQNLREKERETQNSMGHFTFLRKYWNRNEQLSSESHVQKLIHNVGSIKGHIKSIIKKQNNVDSNIQLHKLILQSPEYMKIKAKLEETEEDFAKYKAQNDSNKGKSMKEMERITNQLKSQNQELKQILKVNSKDNSTNSQDENTTKKMIVKSATNQYSVIIKSKELTQKQIYSSLSKQQIVSYFQNGGRKGKQKTLENGHNQKVFNFSAGDITKTKFISHRINK